MPSSTAGPGYDNVWPRISIVTISYNQATYLETAIRSVILQGYPNLEYIIVDGGSTDGSRSIIEKYSPWISWWVSEPDRGQADAINKGFAHCTGDIITFLSSDDYYLPGAFHDVATQVRRNPELGAIVGGFRFLDEGMDRPGELQKPFLDGGSPVDLSLGPPGKYRLHQVATFYTRPALDMVGRYVREDMKYVMDRELLYRVCRDFPMALSDSEYGVFRRHPGSKSTAEIIPFAREFARLYESSYSGEPEKDRQRKHMAHYRLARGYMKLAHVNRSRLNRLGIMFQAACVVPEFVFVRSNLRRWLWIVKGESSDAIFDKEKDYVV